MPVEKRLEMRGMRRSEIINYFTALYEKNISKGKFIGQNWQVEINKEKFITIGSLNIPTTIVIFRGSKEDLGPVISAFRMKFLSAGG